jgi:transcriptional regulator with PAS, ATPase and Fis domain
MLIEGETGTGKELVARAMHYSGPRSEMPFIPVNCGALAEHLIENEFFGHARGACSDARESQAGLIAQAQGCTLFLDEVDTLPLRGQVALLRFLQDLRYRPLGASRDQQADIRVITATNVNLRELVAEPRFRPDLFYQPNIFSLALPALRERPGDAELLATHFVRLYGGLRGSPASASARWRRPSACRWIPRSANGHSMPCSRQPRPRLRPNPCAFA